MNNVVITSRARSVTVDVEKLSAEIITKLIVHGLTQKVADAASGAKAIADKESLDVGDVTESLMQKAADALLAGEWSSRSAGEAVSEETKVQRLVTRNMVKAKFGAKSPEWAKFTGLSDDEQDAKLDAWFAANAEKLDGSVKDELKRREAARKAKAKLADGVVFEL